MPPVPKPVKPAKVKKKRKKVSHETIAYLKNKLWGIFSEYKRLQYSTIDGYASCFTCDVVKPYKKLHAGHFVEKSTCTLPGYFSEIGVNPQCPQCNLFKSGNKDEYAIRLEKEYGVGIITLLDVERKQEVENEHNWLTDKIIEYREKLRLLKETKELIA